MAVSFKFSTHWKFLIPFEPVMQCDNGQIDIFVREFIVILFMLGLKATPIYMAHHLTLCGIVTPYRDIDLGQRWLK